HSVSSSDRRRRQPHRVRGWSDAQAVAAGARTRRGTPDMVTVADIFESMAWGPAPEAAEPAFSWLDQHQRRFGHLVGGDWREGASTFEVVNPANRQVLANVAQGTPADVDAAVQAARSAFEGWSSTAGHVRARYLYALARQVQKHSRLFAVLETL